MTMKTMKCADASNLFCCSFCCQQRRMNVAKQLQRNEIDDFFLFLSKWHGSLSSKACKNSGAVQRMKSAVSVLLTRVMGNGHRLGCCTTGKIRKRRGANNPCGSLPLTLALLRR